MTRLPRRAPTTALVRYAHRVLSIGDGRLAQVEADEVVGAGDEL